MKSVLYYLIAIIVVGIVGGILIGMCPDEDIYAYSICNMSRLD